MSAKGERRDPLLCRPDAPLVQVGQAGHRARLQYEAGAGLRGRAGAVRGGSRRTCAAGTIQITPEKQQLIGVEYGTAEYRSSVETIRAAAKVALDETQIAKVHSKLEGWIDQVFVDFTGKLGAEGPAAAHHLQSRSAGHAAGIPAGAEGQSALLARRPDAAPPAGAAQETCSPRPRKRLELWDISDEQIEQLETHPASRSRT